MRTILVYSGRFQPFCKHHYVCYQWAINQFGKDNCYIATSNVVSFPNSPFDFNEKKQIIQQFGIPDDKIIQVENPYNCKELLSDNDKEHVVVVYLVGYKDKDRFKTTDDSYYQLYNPYNKKNQPYTKHSYILISPYISLKTVSNIEYSGTSIRDALYKLYEDAELTDNNRKSLFEKIMGWYDDGTYNMICDKFNKLIRTKNQNVLFTKEWWDAQLVTTVLNENLLCENGVGGHIHHVFDIDWVKSGNDILKCFYKIIDSLEHTASTLKLDGINVSLKIVNNQFVVDRGSNKDRDINGITLQNVDTYINTDSILNYAIKTTLIIFNSALNECKSELQQLGLLDNPNILLNCEYINGKTNIIDYGDKKLISIIGVSEQQLINGTRQFVGTSYNNTAMQSFIEKVNNAAKKYNYHILGNIKCKLTDIPSLDSILTVNVSVYYNDTKIITKSLYEWLSTIKRIPIDIKFKTTNNKTISCVSQNVLISLLNKTKLVDYVVDENMYQYVIDGYIVYLTEILLGQTILDKIKAGYVLSDTIEGIVVNDKTISNQPIKITGNFILKTSLNNKK